MANIGFKKSDATKNNYLKRTLNASCNEEVAVCKLVDLRTLINGDILLDNHLLLIEDIDIERDDMGREESEILISFRLL